MSVTRYQVPNQDREVCTLLENATPLKADRTLSALVMSYYSHELSIFYQEGKTFGTLFVYSEVVRKYLGKATIQWFRQLDDGTFGTEKGSRSPEAFHLGGSYSFIPKVSNIYIRTCK